MKIEKWAIAAAVSAALLFTANQSMAQGQGQGGGQGNGQRRQMDPAQFQQRMAERMKETLEISDEAEWKAVQPLLQKVQEARMAGMAGRGGMMGFGARRGPEGGAPAAGGQDQQRRFGPPPSPEAEALQKAIDAKAPKAELQAALAKFVESRKAKQTELEKAQENLRKVLTARQEAIATLNGLL